MSGRTARWVGGASRGKTAFQSLDALCLSVFPDDEIRTAALQSACHVRLPHGLPPLYPHTAYSRLAHCTVDSHTVEVEVAPNARTIKRAVSPASFPQVRRPLTASVLTARLGSMLRSIAAIKWIVWRGVVGHEGPAAAAAATATASTTEHAAAAAAAPAAAAASSTSSEATGAAKAAAVVASEWTASASRAVSLAHLPHAGVPAPRATTAATPTRRSRLLQCGHLRCVRPLGTRRRGRLWWRPHGHRLPLRLRTGWRLPPRRCLPARWRRARGGGSAHRWRPRRWRSVLQDLRVLGVVLCGRDELPHLLELRESLLAPRRRRCDRLRVLRLGSSVCRRARPAAPLGVATSARYSTLRRRRHRTRSLVQHILGHWQRGKRMGRVWWCQQGKGASFGEVAMSEHVYARTRSMRQTRHYGASPPLAF